jgi:cyanophycinase
MGFILLEGGAEFGGQMELPDRQAISLAGGPDVCISIIAAAAVPDNNHQRAGENGVRWFKSLGATHVTVLPIIDHSSANDRGLASLLENSRLIYLLGGFPYYLGNTLAGSLCWQAMRNAYHAGAMIAGSSAGAMVLCQYYYDPEGSRVKKGLGLISGICVLPHHNSFGQNWAPRLSELLPEIILVGIDEETGMLNTAEDGSWRVSGKGEVTLYRRGQLEKFSPQQTFVIAKAASSLKA